MKTRLEDPNDPPSPTRLIPTMMTKISVNNTQHSSSRLRKRHVKRTWQHYNVTLFTACLMLTIHMIRMRTILMMTMILTPLIIFISVWQKLFQMMTSMSTGILLFTPTSTDDMTMTSSLSLMEELIPVFWERESKFYHKRVDMLASKVTILLMVPPAASRLRREQSRLLLLPINVLSMLFTKLLTSQNPRLHFFQNTK